MVTTPISGCNKARSDTAQPVRADTLNALIKRADSRQGTAFRDALASVPNHVLGVMQRAGRQYVALENAERYSDASTVLRRLAAMVDDWGSPRAGLFVCEERCIYLRWSRAFLSANDLTSLWPRVSPERVQALDPEMSAIMTWLFT